MKQDEEIKELKKEAREVKEKEHENEIEKIEKRIHYKEDYFRRKNLRIDGMVEDPDENWEVTQNKVQRLMRENLG
ncbi:hypothetical protein E2C01_077475 [Portunus trituberculatus]|uniref:Uncharacterized protein n=1 Tax=Portunus trituberculatus TaxID=210409 RepID=A0A5B7IG60_PORTR|nr:hypothetical protein [Portunus trituberculatus]